MDATPNTTLALGQYSLNADGSVSFRNQITCDAFIILMEDIGYTNWIYHAEEAMNDIRDELTDNQFDDTDFWAIADAINATNEELHNIH